MPPDQDIKFSFPRNPLVLATALFLLGVACGRFFTSCGPLLVGIATASWLLWLLAEVLRQQAVARGTLAGTIVFCGAAVWVLNQNQIEPDHIARFLPADGETLVTLRAVVEVPPEAADSHADSHFIARAQALWTDRGWLDANGDLLVNWSGPSATVHPGEVVELYGWLARPPPAMNPGAFDARRQLAADRLFAQVRVPHATGVVSLDLSGASAASPLERFRLVLRAKLLQHTVQEDVPAAYTLTALLLGYRDPIISDVSQSFADAGVAHLLAISGSHIVFFAALAWAILRFFPLRPRWRDILIAAIVGVYVLATPCNPPILRAAIGLLIVLLARLLGRPRQYLNMLCAAALVVVLLRPMDIEDAGFQLSFAAAAGLILLSARVHAALFGDWLARETLVAELARSRPLFWRLRAYRLLAALLTANLIGTLTAMPLVAYHFGQVNPWAILTGIVALPAVSVALVTAACQLLAEVMGLGALLAPLSALVGKVMIWVVQQLAALPGAAVPLRPPPAWLVFAAYGAILLWIARDRLRISRAGICNTLVGFVVVSAAWYSFTAPVGHLQITALNAGEGSCLLVRTPTGQLWAINAGNGQSAASSLVGGVLRPAMRIAGARRLDGLILISIDAPHASEAREVIETFRPRELWLAQGAWEFRGRTLAGAGLSIADNPAIKRGTLARGQSLELGEGCLVRALWPFSGVADPGDGLILDCSFEGPHVLVADPRQADALPMAAPDTRFDTTVFTGPPRESESLRDLTRIAPLGNIIWSGHGVWTKGSPHPADRNTDKGAVRIDITHDRMTIIQ